MEISFDFGNKSSEKRSKVVRKNEPIRFFKPGEKHGIFSNFSRTALTIDGLEYASVEHYFQSMKFKDTDPEYSEEIRLAPTPVESRRLGSSREHVIHPFWGGKDGESLRVMRRVLLYKALQNQRFKNLLLSTGDALLIDSSKDRFWGDGAKGRGRNMLGKMLMDLRESLRNANF